MKENLNIAIYEVNDGEDKIRVYEVDGGWHSAMYLDEKRQNELVFPYLKATANIFDKNMYTKLLMLGGGMFSFARYALANNPIVKVDVVEIDEMAIQSAYDYFFLNEFEEKYNIKGTDRLNVYIEDAKDFILATNNKYDFIFNDTYIGTSIVSSLLSKKYLKETKNKMYENGIYVANLPGKKNIKKSYLLMDTIHNLNKLFKNVYLVSARGELASDNLMNYIVIASDRELEVENAIDYS